MLAAAAAAASGADMISSPPSLTIADIIGHSDYEKIKDEIGTQTWMEAMFTSEVTQSFSAVLQAIKNKTNKTEQSNGYVDVAASADQVKTVRALEEKGTIVKDAIVLGATPASLNSGLHDLLELLADDDVIEKYSERTAVKPTSLSLLDTVLFALVKPRDVA